MLKVIAHCTKIYIGFMSEAPSLLFKYSIAYSLNQRQSNDGHD